MNRQIKTTHTLFSRLVAIGAAILNTLCVLGLAATIVHGPSVNAWLQ